MINWQIHGQNKLALHLLCIPFASFAVAQQMNWFAGDWSGWTVPAEQRDDIELNTYSRIQDQASVYSYGRGMLQSEELLSYVQNKELIVYANAGTVNFIRWISDYIRDYKLLESGFYHINDPASGNAYWDYDNDQVVLHWDWDCRESILVAEGEELFGKNADDHKYTTYTILKTDLEGTPIVDPEVRTFDPETTPNFVDASVLFAELPNIRYRIVSRDLPDTLTYSRLIPVQIEDIPHFWIADKPKAEFQYSLDPAKSAELLHLTVDIGYNGNLDTSDIVLQYQSSAGDVQDEITVYDHNANPLHFELPGISREKLQYDGSYVFKIVLRQNGEEIRSFPDWDDYYWMSVNNRFISQWFPSYPVRITGEGSPLDAWQTTLTNDAIYAFGPEGADGVFFDDVQPSIPYTHQISIEDPLPDPQYYKMQMEALIRTTTDNVRSIRPGKLVYLNNARRNMLLQIVSPPPPLMGVAINGCMRDGVAQSSIIYNSTLKNCLWIANSEDIPSVNCILRSTMAPEVGTEVPAEHELNWRTNVATYLLTQKDPRLQGNGSTMIAYKKYEYDDVGSKRVPYYPELMIDFGAPTQDIFNGFNWDGLDYDEDDAEGYPASFMFSKGTGPEDMKYFVFRRFERGFVLVNATKGNEWDPSHFINVRTDLPSELNIPSAMYELQLAVGDMAWPLQFGGAIRTVARNMEENIPMYIMPDQVRIFMDQPIASPQLAYDTAIAPLFASEGMVSIIAVLEPTTWDGGPIESIDVVVGAISSNADTLSLNDSGEGGDQVAGDGIWSSAGFQCAASQGEYDLPIHIKSLHRPGHYNDNLELYSSLKAIVVQELHNVFVNKSGFTDALSTAELLPYSSTPLDYDQDGKLDMFVANKSGDNSMLFRHYFTDGGVPQFQDLTDDAFPEAEYPPPSQARGVSVGDFDHQMGAQGESWPDLFIAHHDESRIYWNNNGVFMKYGDEDFDSLIQGSWVGVWGDYDAAGWIDLFVGMDNAEGYNPDPYDPDSGNQHGVLIRNLFGNLDKDYWQWEFYNTHPIGTMAAAWGLANGDLLPDLFMGDYYIGPNHGPIMFINTGVGGMTYQLFDETETWFQGAELPQNVTAAVWYDYDGDQKQDLMIGSHVDAPTLRLFHNEGNENFSEVDLKAMGCWKTDHPINGLAAFDYDNDRSMDVLVVPENEEDPILLYACKMVNGQRRFVDLAGACSLGRGSAEGITVADFDRDGRPDLYLDRPSSEGKFYFKNVPYQGPDQHWIEVGLSGGGGNNYGGIGAQVRVQADGVTQMQVKSAGYGRGLQQDPMLHFGLGEFSGSTVDVTVIWPDSNVQTQTCPVDTLSIIEDNTDPQMIAETVHGSYRPGPGGTLWIFTWCTEHLTDIRLDSVNLISSYYPGDDCFCGGSQTLHWGDRHVEVEITAQPDGTYEHELTWDAGCCFPGCTHQYQVHSATRFAEDVSAIKDMRMKVCASQ